MHGILNIAKPQGMTSFNVVSIVRRLSGERRVGHAGTLDPMATGVLPVCLGQGTRVIEFLVDASKAYRAEIELGIATDTYDADGKIIQTGDCSGISREQIESALTAYCGLIEQTPPMYSAIKHQGNPLYKLARAGIEVERKSRLIEIYNLEFIGWQSPVLTLEVVCSKGTYIRSLAHDLGQTLGCGANLKNLVRLRCGYFDIKDSVSLPQLEDAFQYGYWQSFVYPIDTVLSYWSAMVVNDSTEQSIRNGCPLSLRDNTYLGQHLLVPASKEKRCRVYSLDGCFLGVLRLNSEKEQWQPEKIFSLLA